MPDLNPQQFPMESLLGMHTFEHGSRVGDVIHAWRGKEGFGQGSPADVRRTGTLSRSLARNGMRKPIVVRQETDGFQHLVHGHHRVAAAHQLGWSSVPVRLVQ